MIGHELRSLRSPQERRPVFRPYPLGHESPCRRDNRRGARVHSAREDRDGSNLRAPFSTENVVQLPFEVGIFHTATVSGAHQHWGTRLAARATTTGEARYPVSHYSPAESVIDNGGSGADRRVHPNLSELSNLPCVATNDRLSALCDDCAVRSVSRPRSRVCFDHVEAGLVEFSAQFSHRPLVSTDYGVVERRDHGSLEEAK